MSEEKKPTPSTNIPLLLYQKSEQKTLHEIICENNRFKLPKKAVDAQKSLQSELIESQAVLDNLNNYLEAQRAATKEGSKVKPCFDELVPQLQVSFKS